MTRPPMTRRPVPAPRARGAVRRRRRRSHLRYRRLLLMAIVGVSCGWLLWCGGRSPQMADPNLPGLRVQAAAGAVSPPLAMVGGDPHIRALMRTISLSESNVSNPYAVIYGGSYAPHLRHHPQDCVPIRTGPNVGLCSTAAGRYQMIDTTWAAIAKRYHPHPSRVWVWQDYSFEPQYQDWVVYRWLDDPRAWGMDLAAALRSGQVDTVLTHLSPTWTSLGGGIEENSMTRYLSRVYQELLQDEQRLAAQRN